MSSERLIDALSVGLAPVKRRSVARELGLLGVLGAIELALYLLSGAMRPDIGYAATLPSFWWKLGSLGLIAAAGIATALRSFDPAGSPRRGLRVLAALIVAALAVGWLIDAAGATHPALAERLMWRDGIACATKMVILSTPAIVALGVIMRRGAPIDRPGSALAAGIASAAWGAFVFVFACPHDDPLYLALWYVVGCGIVAIAGRLILPRIARW